MKHIPRIPKTVPRGSVRVGRTRRPLVRIQLIHECIRAKRYPNCSTLAREIEVTPKTIQRDISYMRDEMRLPLQYHEERHGYFYTRAVSEFPLLQLSHSDLMALFLARKAMEPLRGTRLERMLAQSFGKIAEACPGDVSFEWRDLDEAFSVKAAGVMEADVSLFGELLDAVMERREVEFDYRKLSAERSERRRVCPYHVGQIDHGWYVIAHDPQRNAMRTFALQRIRDLTVLRSRFERPADFNAKDHMGGSFGVWTYNGHERQSHHVCIQFDGYAARIVEERRWHDTQQIVPVPGKKGAIEFRARLAGLEEVTRWVLSWGSRATVVSPPVLVDLVRGEVEELSRRLLLKS